MIKLRVLRWGEYPGFLRWVLSVITSILKEGEGDFTTSEKENRITKETERDLRWYSAHFEDGVMDQRMQKWQL